MAGRWQRHPVGRAWTLSILGAALVACGPAQAAPPTAGGSTAAKSNGAMVQALRQAGVDRGLAAVLGFHADLALPLAGTRRFLVHVLEPDVRQVAQLRQATTRAGIGIDRVVIEAGKLDRLPYADQLVDVVAMVFDAGATTQSPSIDELLRVLRPKGVAFIRLKTNSPADRSAAEKWLGSHRKLVISTQVDSDNALMVRKPVPAGTDNWTHWEHGPDNNPISTDQVIKAPYLTQFLAEPYYITMPSITTAAGGRTFLATGHIAHHRREWDTVNQLIARNGYNGIEIWRRPLPEGFLAHRSAFAATDDTFYLMDGDGCLLLDAATGQERRRLAIPGIGADWKWMVLRDGVLYVMAGPADGPAEVIKGDRTFGGWSWADLSRGYYQRPRVPWGFGHTVAAYDLEDDKLLWKHQGKDLIDSRALAMTEDRLLMYCPDKHFRCLATDSGSVLWTNDDDQLRSLIEQPGRGLVSTPGFRSACLTVATPDAFVIQGQTRMNVVAISPDDGKHLWTKKKFTNNPNAVYMDGRLILGVGPRGSHVALNPKTGQELADLHFRKQACTRLTGCPDSLFVRGEGTLRFDRQSGKVLIDGGVRPACNDGVIAANGMLYIGPWACDCNLSLIGATARCSAGQTLDLRDQAGEPLQQVSAELDVAAMKVRDTDWPTYRANNARSAATPAALATPVASDPPTVIPRWTYTPRQPVVVTPPVGAGNFVYVAGDDGVVRALDSMTGQPAWQFATAGPIKAAPTVWRGRLFVGSGDGYVYALEAVSGRLLWRFRAAPFERRMMVYGRLSSTWPVNTGVLVNDGIAYFAAGILDQDGTYVYAINAINGQRVWLNDRCGHLNETLRKGVSAQGNLSIAGDHLLMAGGNQTSPAIFELATGKCLNDSFAQGQPKANHGRFVGVLDKRFPVVGGRILYCSPRNVANKDSFVVVKDGRPLPLAFGGVPPTWNQKVTAVVNFRNGALLCYHTTGLLDRLDKGFPPPAQRDRPQQRWANLLDLLDADGGRCWQTNLDSPNKFEVLALATTPQHVVAVVQFQNRVRAHPQWQVVAFQADTGTPVWFWRHDLPGEPLPEALAVGHRGQLLVCLLDGRVLSLGPKRPAPARGRP